MSEESQRAAEWDALYEDLVCALAACGRNDPCGDEDFWLVDDDWGSFQHKLCVTRLAFLTKEVVEAIQRALSKYPAAWEVIVALDFPDPTRPIDSEGIVVRRTAIEQNWDKVRLAQRFGTEFRWRMA